VGEGEDAAVGVLAAGRVEVAAEDARRVRLRTEVGGDRLVGADLGELRRGRDRRVQVDEFEVAVGGDEDALRPRDSGRLERGERLRAPR
jgi:hypothetical protein